MKNDICILHFNINFLSDILIGYSQEMGYYAEKIQPKNRGYEKKVVNLEQKFIVNDNWENRPSFPVSSFRGVLRSASAWMLEKFYKDSVQDKEYITCDYTTKSTKKDSCPLCHVYGGPEDCRKDKINPSKKAGISSKLTLTFNQSNMLNCHTDNKSYRFAWTHIAGNNSTEPMKAEFLKLCGNKDNYLEITINQADPFSIALVCLSLDMISSGHFRCGRFTSRGFGMIRFVPHSYFYGNFYDFIDKDSPLLPVKNGIISGKELSDELLGKDSIILVKEELKSTVK